MDIYITTMLEGYQALFITFLYKILYFFFTIIDKLNFLIFSLIYIFILLVIPWYISFELLKIPDILWWIFILSYILVLYFILWKLKNNTIFVCLARDVLEYMNTRGINEKNTISRYYPFLYNKNVFSLSMLKKESIKLIENSKKTLNKIR